MRFRFAVLLAGTALAAAVAPASAHHSFAAEFDSARPVTLKGTVTRIEWTNPHAHVFVDVKDDKGETKSWKFELASPKVLAQLCVMVLRQWTWTKLSRSQCRAMTGLAA